jgi:hypothetical protein
MILSSSNAWLALTIAILSVASGRAQEEPDFSPQSQEQQLPRAMHAAMQTLPTITVGTQDADIVGQDHRALQAAVDYIASLGGGVVEIGPGEFLMSDSLHLRPLVTVRGTPGKTILRKAKGVVSPLALDGDFGEEQITLVAPEGFAVGYGVAIWDDKAGGFHTTVARIVGATGSTFAIDKPLNADCMVASHAQAATVFPVVSGYDAEGARIEHLIIEGNKEENVALNGCRGGGVFLYRCHHAVIEDCTISNYHGDGVSFQQSNDVRVERCVSSDNTGLGLHPGSGSQRAVVRECVAKGNGEDGLFLCWRVRHGLFEKNVLENNGRYGISIGHKDSDNVLRDNLVKRNGEDGVMFRNETLGMAPHRNRLESNRIEENGARGTAAGIRIRGAADGLVFRNNIIRDTRAAAAQTQAVGIHIEMDAGEVTLEANDVKAKTDVVDQRPAR